jgi:hypothetical protein
VTLDTLFLLEAVVVISYLIYLTATLNVEDVMRGMKDTSLDTNED